MEHVSKAAKLRRLFAQPGLIRLVGAHDGLSAKLVERHGFEGIWASGLEISCSYAVPDADILSMSQYLERARSMNDVVSIPVIADCDTGGGNSLNVIHTVRQYEAAGIAAVCFEDKKFPKVNSFVAGRQEMASIAEFVGKIMAAKNAQESEDFMVIARIEAFIAGWGKEEALARAHAYVQAGADAVLIHSKLSDPSEVKSFCDEWDGNAPVVVVPTTYPTLTQPEMEQMGVKMVIYANHGMRSALKAMDETMARISADGGVANLSDSIAPLDLVFEIQGMAQMKEDELNYIPTPESPVRAVILAAGAPTNQDSLMPLLADTPLAMLDINGKSLLQKNVETLRTKGVTDITAVVGYLGDQIELDGVHFVENPDYQQTHILDSLMKAESKLEGRVLLCYGDVLFDKTILDVLLERDEDILLVADPSFQWSRLRNKKLDLVRTRFAPALGRRSLPRSTNPVVSVAFEEASEGGEYEFTGIMLLSPAGTEALRREYQAAQEAYTDKPFQQAETFQQASLTDMLNHMIQRGHAVHAVEVQSGWMEIHTFDDYRIACQTLA